MQHRLEQFLQSENITKAQFADRINVARAGISHIMAGRNKPGYEFIINTMEAFPELNIEWLLCGRGTMYRDSSSVSSGPSLFSDSPSYGATDLHDASVSPASKSSSEASVGTGLPAVERTQEGIDGVFRTANSGGRNISRIVVFFDDGTFRDYREVGFVK